MTRSNNFPHYLNEELTAKLIQQLSVRCAEVVCPDQIQYFCVSHIKNKNKQLEMLADKKKSDILISLNCKPMTKLDKFGLIRPRILSVRDRARG